MAERKPALGKGLSALIPDVPEPASRAAALDVDIDLIEPNEYQPRTQYDETRLEELAQSIRANGVIQPIVVRRVDEGGKARFRIIAGERRWRASQRAGLLKVPVVVKDVTTADGQRLLEMALIENIQREDLNPIEEAHAYQRLVDDFRLRQEDIATQVGKDRSSVANYLRLLKLPAEVQANVASGALSMGHARALVTVAEEAEQRRLAREIIARGLSVRETEGLVKKPAPKAPKEPPRKDVHTRAAEEQLHLALGARVEIRRKGAGGELVISYGSEDELQRLYEYLTSSRR
ncbi:MAG: ParB/RepB/Spo0J family partition protein [Vicinamibacterales bacterium]